jgi:hypothetical protein
VNSALKSLEGERWLVVLLLAGLLALAAFVVADFDVGLPEFPRSERRPGLTAAPLPVGRIDALWSTAALRELFPPTNVVSPFYTAHFVPAVPKPPTTQKVSLTYLGFFQTAQGEKRAFVLVGDRMMVGPAGAKVVGDLVVGEIALQRLVLQNPSAQTNVLEFNKKKELELPVQ